MFFVEGGTLAIENTLKTAFDWKIRKNLAKGKGEKGTKVLHFKNAFHGRSGYSLSMTNTADPRKTQYFPKFDWPRLSCPRLRFPVTDEVVREVAAAEEAVEREIRAACAASPDDIAALILEPIQGEGGDNHFRPELFRRRSGGAAAAVAGAPRANVLVLAHSGFCADGRARPWWRLPIHRQMLHPNRFGTDHPYSDLLDELGPWLDRTWTQVDSWVATHSGPSWHCEVVPPLGSLGS